jgi:hypothetical protein
MVESGFAPAGTPSGWNLIANEMILIDCSHLVLGIKMCDWMTINKLVFLFNIYLELKSKILSKGIR